MPLEEAWSEIVPKFARAPLLAYKYRKLVRTWAYRALVAVGWGKTDVLVVGRPGAGKSVLMERFAGRTGDLNWQAPNVSTSVESAVLVLGKDPLIVRTIPGQDSRERSNGLHEALSRHNNLQGIIYVADWGYNAVRDPAVAIDRVKREGLDTIEKLRLANLNAEVSDFSGIAQRIKDAHSRTGGVIWLLIAVNKADLFIDRLNDAQGYYHPATPHGFNNVILDLNRTIGANSFRCEIVPISSWHEDFEWNNEILVSHINEGQARALFANMRDRVSNLSKWWSR